MKRCYPVLTAISAILCLSLAASGWAQSTQPDELEELIVTATRLDNSMTGASVTVIHEEEIQSSPAEDLPNLLGLEVGVYNRDFFSGVNGARATVDMRGFGAVGTQNTLLLLDGRRLTDFDLAAVDFTNIPIDNIKQIEIIRGNAGSVLYGDGAVGGAINIVTKSPANQPNSANIDYTYAQEQRHETNLFATQSWDRYSLNFSSNYVHAHGFRDNNKLVQRNALAQLRYTGDKGEGFVKLGGDFQSLELPGERLIDRGLGIDQFESDPVGATDPFNKALQNGLRIEIGTTHKFDDGTEFVVDAGMRRKDQDSDFISDFSTVDTTLTTWSLTPRANLGWSLLGQKHNTKVGTDLYYAYYDSDRRQFRDDQAQHEYRAHQTTFGIYGQDKFRLTERLNAQVGARFIWVAFTAGDGFNPGAPGAFGSGKNTTRQIDQTYVYNFGIEYELDRGFLAFGRTSRGVRLPTIDERISSSDPNTFKLKTQTSQDLEAGLSYQTEKLAIQGSAFIMKLKNELRLNINLGGGFGLNDNSDPTRRIGGELTAVYRITPHFRFKANAAFVDAKFREGDFSGNSVPLTPQWQLGSSVNWEIIETKLNANLSTSYVDRARLENDESAEGEQIPEYYVVDLRLGGKLVDTAFSSPKWSFEITNILNRKYYNYGVRAGANPGARVTRFNVFPLAGRAALIRLNWPL